MRIVPLVAVALLLAGCASSGNEPKVTEVEPNPTPPVETNPVPEVNGNGPMTAGQIMKALAGRKFAYSKPGRKGTVQYFSDGTFTYSEAGKGEGTGVWQASDGKLCEAFDPSPVIPAGTRSECHPFASNGGNFTAGPISLVPA